MDRLKQMIADDGDGGVDGGGWRMDFTGRTSDNNTLDGLHDGLNLFLMKDVKGGESGCKKKMGWDGMEKQRQRRRKERNEMWRIG